MPQVTKSQGINNNQLAIQRTKLANQRTYLAYMRTGFAIAGIAGKFKKHYLMMFGLFMILTSAYQYYIAINYLNSNVHNDNQMMDYIPLIYVVLSIAALYLQFFKK
tara:strand:+ start:152 stop:469 length:318 start_codon:yes stop_codon:yes gene_type:complete